MAIKLSTTVAVGGIVAIAAVIVLLYALDRWGPPPPQPIDPKWAHCHELLGRDVEIGLDVDQEGKTVNVAFGAGYQQNPVTDPALMEGFLTCVRDAYDFALKLPPDLERIPEPMMLGEIAAIWARRGPLKLTLRPSNDELINNLAVIPSAGTRWQVIGHWCRPESLGACIACEPDQVTAETAGVTIRVRNATKFTREPIGPPGAPRADGTWEDWQLVETDADGKATRYGYRCQP